MAMYTGTRELSRRLRCAYVDVTLNSSRPGGSRVNECTTVCFFFPSRQYHVAHLGVPPDWQLRLEPALSPGSPNGSLEKSATNDATPPSGPTACRRITIVRCTIACSCQLHSAIQKFRFFSSGSERNGAAVRHMHHLFGLTMFGRGARLGATTHSEGRWGSRAPSRGLR